MDWDAAPLRARRGPHGDPDAPGRGRTTSARLTCSAPMTSMRSPTATDPIELSRYMIAFFLLWKLSEKVILVPPNMLMTGVGRYIKSGGLLIGRTIAVLLTMTLSTSLTAREGPLLMAGHQICLHVWLAVSLLNDALALAGQVLLSLISSLFLLMVAPAFGLAGVWTGLFLFMCLRTIAGFWRLRTKSGPWKLVWSEMAEGMKEK